MIIGYFADGPWAHLALEKLLLDQEIRVAFICGRFDKQDPVLRQKAESAGIPFFTSKNINSSDFMKHIERYRCELFVSMSFNQIFKKPIIDMPLLGTINCHAGKLPFYRGRNILNWALINDEKEFGITVHYVDDGIDTGDIILQQCFPITDQDDYGTLLERAYVGCADLLIRSLHAIRSGEAERTPQKNLHPVGFYCSERVVGDERLNWGQPSRQIFNFVRAICPPGPSAQCFCLDNEIKIKKVELIDEAQDYRGIPGAILAKDERSFLVKTLDSFVRVVEWDSEIKLRVGDRLT